MIHVAGRALFVKGAYSPPICLETVRNVRFAMQTKTKQKEKKVEDLMKRVEANDAVAMCVLGSHYIHGGYGLLQDQEKALELWKYGCGAWVQSSSFPIGCLLS